MISIQEAGFLFALGFAGLEIINVAIVFLVAMFFNWQMGELKNEHEEDKLRLNSELGATNRAFVELMPWAGKRRPAKCYPARCASAAK